MAVTHPPGGAGGAGGQPHLPTGKAPLPRGHGDAMVGWKTGDFERRSWRACTRWCGWVTGGTKLRVMVIWDGEVDMYTTYEYSTWCAVCDTTSVASMSRTGGGRTDQMTAAAAAVAAAAAAVSHSHLLHQFRSYDRTSKRKGITNTTGQA
ncbi:hypothetical protein B0T17DRAFT_508545 [Bombardia bombarda]|uniref:Uncharacterized protein n=1 Tax=Bombardia bombarda TaxID=252184 RepID=A0AA40C167_9PEZI|nr:hypothetical protein B0T17DRAFT_508545 [Bombardia bombarda]